MRHVQLIAISGSIGAALFVSIGGPLTSAGPLGLLLGVIFWSFVVFCASNCLIEMTTLLPLDGGFISFAERFVDKSFAMALGWNVSHFVNTSSVNLPFQYIITQWALICFELTAINVIVEYWEPLHPAILISACLVAIGALNLFSVRFFGEAEFWISITKIFLIFGLILYTFITMLGGYVKVTCRWISTLLISRRNPLKDRYGFRFWRDPGVFAGTNFREVITGIFDSVCWATFA
jgi:amino acid transporter